MNRPKLRDNVEVGTDSEGRLHFVFVNSRRHLTIKASESVRRAVSMMDGKTLAHDIGAATGLGSDGLGGLLCKMEAMGLVGDSQAEPVKGQPALGAARRQIQFFDDFVKDSPAAQERLRSAKVAVIGLGAIGGGVVAGLARAGMGNLVGVDGDRVEECNLCRHQLFTRQDVGQLKADAAGATLRLMNPALEYRGLVTSVTGESELAEIVRGCSLVINCADQPSVATTPIKPARSINK